MPASSGKIADRIAVYIAGLKKKRKNFTTESEKEFFLPFSSALSLENYFRKS